MTESRPSLQRKHTRKTEERRSDALDAGLKIVIDDEVYEVRLGDITPAIAREVRREFGMGPQKFLATMADDPDVDLFAGFVWIARRVRGDAVDLAEVEAGIGYHTLLSDDVEFAIAGAEVVDDDPEG